MKIQKGFTLIELLVVIAIIGILSSVVLASLNTARGKGADAAIKSNLANIRAQAEIIYDGRSCYNDNTNGTCTTAFVAGACAATAGTLFANTNVTAQITAAGTAYGGTIASGRCVEDATDSAWAVAMPLKTGGTVADTIPDAWCVDSLGTSRSYTYLAAETLANALNATACR
jgi:prepilin-type N-terminal cleavage/methylation domain-containing protein